MYYELYIDVLFLVNFMMDFILLLLVRRILKFSASYGNICLGALAGSILTCAAVAIPIPYSFIKFIWFHAVVNVVMLMTAFRTGWRKKLWKGLGALYICGFILGGILEFLGQYISPYIKAGSLFFAVAVAGYYISSAVLNLMTSFLHFGEFHCPVTLYVGNKRCEIQAIVDTGNHLKDGLTGKAVSVMGRQTAENLFGGKMPEKFRYIPYHSIGKKSGVIPVVTLDWMCIGGEEEQWIESPLVGISETDISSDGEYDLIINPDV
ncbi:sigma-E processing peptidase SpoIIGA [Sporofaciens sp. SGI.106]|uniref:sigma-E processing peptidase SpoIIGA n=1 Tax=Sporofaciens sp. SGI.106 TaxID=3420568 RepID=UPI002A95455A|nr:sigma-E processing peptidase SpoIIGA [Lachnoclostridium sp.]